MHRSRDRVTCRIDPVIRQRLRVIAAAIAVPETAIVERAIADALERGEEGLAAALRGDLTALHEERADDARGAR